MAHLDSAVISPVQNSRLKEFSTLFVAQLVSYLLITLNYRAVAQGLYVWTGASDLLFATVNFAIIKKIAKSESKYAWAGYTVGGVCGSLLGIALSKIWYGQ